jgi:hypothetical protein
MIKIPIWDYFDKILQVDKFFIKIMASLKFILNNTFLSGFMAVPQ